MGNSAQIQSMIRSAIIAILGAFGGVIATNKWLTQDQVSAVLNSPVILSFVGIVAAAAWGIISKTVPNLVTFVNSLPDVSAIITKPTVSGVALASACPSDTVIPAGTKEAVAVAQKTTG